MSDSLNLDFLHASTLTLPHFDEIVLIQVGCGGTGSWLAPTTARVARILREEQNKKVRLIYCDPDTVELANIHRQHFCDAEIGRNKAECMAVRYSTAWGVPAEAWTCAFAPELVDMWGFKLVIGCVDNAAARQSIHELLDASGQRWWLDCGNSYASGQVTLGNAIVPEQLEIGFRLAHLCTLTPNPAWLHPNLLVPLPEELAAPALSCDTIALHNLQGLSVNQNVAAIATNYLVKLLLTHDLKTFASYFDLTAGATRSEYATLANVRRAVHLDDRARLAGLDPHPNNKTKRKHHARR